MSGLFPSQLELATLGAFASSEKLEAERALQRLEDSPAFMDPDCLRLFKLISQVVYSKDCGSTIEESKLLLEAQLTGRGSKDVELLQASVKVLEKTPWLAGCPDDAAKVLIQAHKRQRAIDQLTKAAGRLATSEDPAAEMNRVVESLAEMTMQSRRQKTKEQLVEETLKEIDDVMAGRASEGIDLGVIPPADSASRLRGLVQLKPSKLYTVGALKKTGKSKFLLHTMWQAVKRSVPCSYVSLEMTDRKVLEWWLSTTTMIDSSRIPSRNLQEEERRRIHAATEEYLLAPMQITYHPGAPLAVVRHEARKLRSLYPNSPHAILGLDHIGLMQHDRSSGNEALAFEESCKGLMRIAQEFEIAVVLLSQCPVSAEFKKEPGIADLKWSGAIAECSEAIMMLHNSGRQTDEGSNNINPRQAPVSMRLWQRDGRSNVRVKMIADLTCGRFYEVAA